MPVSFIHPKRALIALFTILLFGAPFAPLISRVYSATITPDVSAQQPLPEQNQDGFTPMAGSSCQLSITDAGDGNPFTFAFAAINTQGISGYTWDFGDGNGGSGDTASHTYTSTGTFTVTLTCIPTSGSNLVLTGSISVSSSPVASFSVTPGTSGYAPFTINIVNTSSGGGLTYAWSVTGPETHSSSAAEPSFTLNAYGTYTITLTITDGANQQAAASQTVQVLAPAPSATFTVSPASGTAPLTVTITGIDNGTGPITSWNWTFGDGVGTATGPGPHTYVYNAENTYTITMTYAGPGGNGSVSKQVGVYPPAQPVAASFVLHSTSNGPGGSVTACFENTSTGPVATSTWDFGDGTGPVVNNSSIVCHTFAAEGSYTITLNVVNADSSSTSNETRTESLWRGPLAAFTASATSITWGTAVSFDSTSSTGTITAWAWDFNNDGTTDSTEQNPSNVQLNTIGSNLIRLTVTGPGGSSTAEMTIMVALLQLTCDFSGNLNPLPNTTEGYTGTVGSLNGRTPTFSWTVTGPGTNLTLSTQNISVNWGGEGSYFVTFRAQTPDGAQCSHSRTVYVEWPDLTCGFSAANLAPYPDGSTYTYTASVGNLYTRTLGTYRWYVDGVEQVGQTGDSITLSWSAPTTTSIRYVVETTDGTGDCDHSVSAVVAWPALICTSIGGGSSNPLPMLPNNPTRSYTYTANTTGIANRTVSYNWSVSAGTINSTSGSNMNISWDTSQAGINPPGGVSQIITVTVTVTNPDSTTDSCTMQRTVSVQIPALQCNVPTGDNTPVVGETVSFGRNLGNVHGRTITATDWTFQESDGAGGWNTIQTGSGSSFPYTFATAGQQYRIRYTASVSGPAENCASAWQTITVSGAGSNFTCDAWNSGNAAPNNPATNYTYSVLMDNTNAINLSYRWVLIGSDGVERTLATHTSTADNVISQTFSGSLFAPMDTYTMRVYVQAVDPADSSHQCSLQMVIVVGTITIDYTFTGNNNAIEVGQQICLTNTSFTSYGGVSTLSYAWDFGTVNVSTGSQTSAAEQPGCFSYTAAGVYTLRLTGTNAADGRSGTRTYTFYVYGSQSITITRSSATFAPANISFTANGVNLTGGYTWRFYDAANTLLGTRTGASTTFFFSASGAYRAEVQGSGPLGTTTASATFELLGTNDIRAAFTPSAYGGQATFHVCFTDNSLGSTINQWEWDFGNGQTLTYGVGGAPAQICADYTTPATVYTVNLRVRNSSGAQATASNVVRTYNLLEMNSTFTITPQGGGRYCFARVGSAGVSVVSWDFGDGTVLNSGSLNSVCHTYQGSGTYLVTMNITDGSTNGTVVRPVTVNLASGPAPALVVNASCSSSSVATFSVQNTGGDMTTPDLLLIRNNNGDIVAVDAYLQLAASETKVYSVSFYGGSITLTTLDTGANTATNCPEPPRLTGSTACELDGTAVFMVANSSPDTAASQTYEIRDNANALVDSGTLNVPANGSVEVRVTNRYDRLSFTSNGTQGPNTNVAMSADCNEPPVLSGTTACAIDGTASFVVENTSTESASSQTYQIRTASNELVASGQLTVASGGMQTIRVSGVYRLLRLTTSGGQQGPTTDLALTSNCDEPPLLSVTSACRTSGAVFMVHNASRDTRASQNFQVLDQSGGILQTGMLSIPEGATWSLEVPGGFGRLTFASSGSQGTTTAVQAETNCDQNTALTGEGLCAAATASFVVVNQNRDLAVNQPYSVLNARGGVVASGTLSLAPGASARIEVGSATGRLTLTTDNLSVSVECANPVSAAVTVHAGYLPLLDLRPGPADSGLTRPGNWEGITVGEAVCTTWILYHTNMTGDWEVFRLGDLPDGQVADPNLSQGPGADVTDMAPTRSPDAEWIAFTSNRDTLPGQPDNWEIYLARVDNSEIRRVTYNTTALDIDPVWSPDGRYIVFETTRDGNWELYLLDLASGAEIRLTDDPASDINAFWSPDSARLVFQSDRSGQWQIYELNIATLETTLLSDGSGEDHDPAYSFDGERIVFRSYRDGDTSVIYIMDADGSSVERISDPAGDALNATWSADDELIAYQSNLDGDSDIYVYFVESRETRLVTDNDIPDFAPTWLCDSHTIVFTSNVTGDPNIYNTPAETPETAPILVESEAVQMTFDEANDVYPESAPAEENASREENVPPAIDQ